MISSAYKVEVYKGKTVGFTKRFWSLIVTPCTVLDDFNFAKYSEILKAEIEPEMTYNVVLGQTWTDGYRISVNPGDSLQQIQFKLKTRENIKYSVTNEFMSPRKPQANKTLNLFWHVDSSIYKVGDFVQVKIQLNADVCPFSKRKEMTVNFKVIESDTLTKSVIVKKEGRCGEYKMTVNKLQNKGDITWTVNGVVKGLTASSNNTFVYKPLTTDTQYVQISYIKEEIIKGVTVFSKHNVFRTFVPKAPLPLQIKNFPDTITCQGDEFAATIELIDPKRKPRISWSYGTITGNNPHIKFIPTNLETFEIQIFDSLSNCTLNEEVAIKLKPHIDNHNDFPKIKLCTDDTISIRLPQATIDGGKWSGPGVTKNRFVNPSLIDSTYDLSLDLESKKYCFTRHQSITTAGFPNLMIDSVINICNGGYPLWLNSNSKNVKWHGKGIVKDSTFQLSVNDTTVLLTAKLRNDQCLINKQLIVHVGGRKSPGTFSTKADTVVCQIDSLMEFSTENLGIGTWNFPNLISTSANGYKLDLSALPIGTTTIKYVGADGWACSDSLLFKVTRGISNKIDLSNLRKTTCLGDDSFKLEARVPMSDVFTGDAVIHNDSGYYFNPALLSAGIYNIYASNKDSLGCPFSDSTSIEIQQKFSMAQIPMDTLCSYSVSHALPGLKGYPGYWQSSSGGKVVNDSLLTFSSSSSCFFWLASNFSRNFSASSCLLFNLLSVAKHTASSSHH